MKKTYAISLDEENVLKLKEWLGPRGLTLSGHINSFIAEQLDVIKAYEVDVKDITFGKFIKMAGKVFNEIKKTNKEVKAR